MKKCVFFSRIQLICSQLMQDIFIYNNTGEITFADPGEEATSDSKFFRPLKNVKV